MIDTTINTKLVAMKADHLSMDELEDFATILSVPEVAEHLRHTKRYRTILNKLKLEDIHRLELEHHLKEVIDDDLHKINRYLDEPFYLIEKEKEIEELFILLQSRKMKTQHHICHPQIKELATLDESALKLALENLGYKEIIPYLDDLLKVEVLLKKHYFICVQNHYLTKNTKLIDALAYEMSLFLLSYIYRYKRYFNASSQEIMDLFDPLLCVFDMTDYLSWIKEGKSHELYTLLNYDFTLDLPIERFIYRTLKKDYLRNMRYENDTYLKIFSYLRLAEIELINMTDIIEGVRYKIGAPKMIELLIKEEHNGN